MKIQWNNCFLCLKDLNLQLPSISGAGRARGRKKKGGDPLNVTILMKYLLQTKNNKYDYLLRAILEACSSTQVTSRKNSKFPIHFCDECTSSVKRVSELHMQLETIQMTLVENLKCVRETIISNSKAHGSNEVTKACLQIFEDFLMTLENHQGPNESSQIDRTTLDLLYSFQEAIFEQGRNTPPQIPFVFLEPISRFKPQLASSDYQEKYPREVGLPPPLTKIEHSQTHSAEDEFEECYSPPPEFDCNDDIDPPFISQQVKHEGSRTMLRRTALRKMGKVQAKVTKQPKKSIDNVQKVPRKPPKQNPAAAGRKKVQPGQTGLAQSKSFKCQTCSVISKRGCKFEHHLRGHETDDKIHICSKCDQKFSGKQLFEYHMNMHAGGTSTLGCDFHGCSVRLPRTDLPDHITKSHGVKVFLCQCCSFSSATRDKYLMHVKMHGKHNLICDVCSAKFKKREKLLSHLFEEHGAVKKLKCDEDGCEQTFLDPVLLIYHKRNHSDVTVYECKECYQVFCSKASYTRHMLTHSKREKTYNCDLCSELFVSRFALEQHKLKDHDAPKLICTYCQEELPDYRKLLSHIKKNHEGARYPCSYCEMTFGSTHSWRRHQFHHSGGSSFVCEECGKLFQTRNSWATHIKTHNEKKFQCSYCSKSFNIARYLKEHIRIHTGEKPWICDHCGKAFSQQGSMQLHKRKVHDLRGKGKSRNGMADSEPQEFKGFGGIFPAYLP